MGAGSKDVKIFALSFLLQKNVDPSFYGWGFASLWDPEMTLCSSLLSWPSLFMPQCGSFIGCLSFHLPLWEITTSAVNALFAPQFKGSWPSVRWIKIKVCWQGCALLGGFRIQSIFAFPSFLGFGGLPLSSKLPELDLCMPAIQKLSSEPFSHV